jgi:hypothetical protein
MIIDTLAASIAPLERPSNGGSRQLSPRQAHSFQEPVLTRPSVCARATACARFSTSSFTKIFFK